MSSEDHLNSTAMIILIIVNCIISLLGISGNSFVVGAFLVSAKVRTKSNFFLCSLAAADLLACLVCIPLWNFVLYTEAVRNEQNLHVHSAYHVILDPLFGVASIMNLLAVSFIRCWMVRRPLHFDAMKKIDFAVAAFVFPWGMGCVAVTYLWEFPGNSGTKTLILVCIVYILPLFIILFCYSVIITTGLRHMNPNTEGYKYATMLIIVVVCFVVTWAPFFTFMIISDHCENCTFVSFLSIGIIKSLQYSNTVMNPLIYSFRSEDFREAFRKILGKVGICSPVAPPANNSQEEMAMSQTCVVPSLKEEMQQETEQGNIL